MDEKRIIHFNDLTPSYWSGGSTTEIFIYPEGSDFKEGNYEIRFSVATVEVATSTFTLLPNTQRTLTLLEGELELDINGKKTSLKPFQSADFLGDDQVTSTGIAKDFNVIAQSGKPYYVRKVGYIKGEVTTATLNEFDNMMIMVLQGCIEVEGKSLRYLDACISDVSVSLKVIEEAYIILIGY